MQLGQHPAPRHAVAHCQRPAPARRRRLQYGVIDTEAGLRRALERLGRRPAAAGDRLHRRPRRPGRARGVRPAAGARRAGRGRMGAEVVWVMGNHDERAPYARGCSTRSPTTRAQDRVHEVDGLRIVSLDTSVPGYHHGELTDAQLAWLADVLATPAPARHAARDAPPADPHADAARGRDDRAARPAPARRRSSRGTDVRGIIAGPPALLDARPSPASPCRWPPPPATPPTRRRWTASSPGSTATRPSRWCTCTTTAWCTRSSRSPRPRGAAASPPTWSRRSRR